MSLMTPDPLCYLDLARSAGSIEPVRLRRRPRSQDTDPTNLAPDVVSSDFLLMCARDGHWDKVRDLLEKAQRTLTQTGTFSALLNALDASGRTVLHYAAWLGHPYIVAHLLRRYKYVINVNVIGPDGFTALQLAAWNNHSNVVSLLLRHPATDPQIGSTSLLAKIISSLNDDNSETSGGNFPYNFPNYNVIRGPTVSYFLYPELYNCCATALHWAVWAGHVGIVKVFLQTLSSERRLKVLNAVDDHLMTPLHYAVLRGDVSIVEALLTSSRVRGDLEEKRKNFTPLDLAYKLIPQAQGRLDVVHKYQLMISMLMERPDVKASSDSLCKSRQVYVDAANAILVVAALIAGISFAGWLQPPLGFQQYYDSEYLLTGSAPAETYQLFAAVRHHASVQVFWIFNSLSFCFAVATMLTGAGTVLPSHATVGRAEVEHIRILLIRASVVLSVSVYFALGAFIAAGFADLPPTVQYRWGMTATSTVGVCMCLIVLYHYFKRMLRLFRFENFSSTEDRLTLDFKGKARIVWRALLHDSPYDSP